MADVTSRSTFPAVLALQQNLGFWRWRGNITAATDYIVCPFSPAAIEIGPTSEVDSAVVYYTDNYQRSVICSVDQPITYPVPCRQGQVLDDTYPNVIIQPFSQAVSRSLFLDTSVLAATAFEVICYTRPPLIYNARRSPYIQTVARLTDGAVFTLAGFGRRQVNLVLKNLDAGSALTSWSFYGYRFYGSASSVAHLINTPASIAASSDAAYVLSGAQFDAYSLTVTGVPAAGVEAIIDMRDA